MFKIIQEEDVALKVKTTWFYMARLRGFLELFYFLFSAFYSLLNKIWETYYIEESPLVTLGGER